MDNLALNIEFLINNDEIRAAVQRAREDISGVASSANQDIESIKKVFSKLAETLKGSFSLDSVTSFIQELSKVRGAFQEIEGSLATMLQSQEGVNTLMKEWGQLTLGSSYTFAEIADSGKQLLAYGVGAQDVTRNIEQLANIASGVSQPLGEIVTLYGTLKTQGKAYQEDINQFTSSGIPIISELARVMKVADSDVRALVESGSVGFPEIEQAINNMTGPAGQFFGLIGEQTGSLPGQINQLQQAWEMMLNGIGTQNEGVLSGGISLVTDLVLNYEKVLDILGTLVITYGAYRAAVIATTAVNAIATQVNAEYNIVQALTGQGMAVLARAQAILNKTMLSNPFVLVATALATLVSYLYLASEETAKLKTASELTADAVSKQGDNVSVVESKLRVYLDMLKDTNVSEEERLSIYNRIKAIDSSIVDGIDAKAIAYDKLKDGMDGYIASLRERYALEANETAIKASIEQEHKLEKNVDDVKNQKVERSQYATYNKMLDVRKADRVEDAQALLLAQKIQTEELVKKNVQAGSPEQIKTAEADLAEIQSQKKKYEKGSKELAYLIKQENNKIAELDKLRTPKKKAAEKDPEIIRAEKFNEDLKAVINNFDSLVGRAQNKADVTKIKEAVSQKINALAPTDVLKRAAYQQKLLKVTAMESQYSATANPPKQKKGEDWGAKKAALMDTITKKANDVDAKDKPQTKDATLIAHAKYDELRNTLNKYNDEAPKAKRIGAGTFKRIDELEKKETGYIRYEKDTEELKISLEKQKQLYAEFEESKTAVGEEEAKKRFAGKVDTETNLQQILKDQMVGLEDGKELTAPQQGRKEMLLKEIEEEAQVRKQASEKRYADAYQAAKTHQQRELEINNDYTTKVNALLKEQNGVLSDEQRKNLEASRDAALESARTEALAKTEAFKKAAETIFELTRQQTKTELAALKSAMSEGGVTDAAKPKVQAQIDKLEGVLKIGVDQTRLNDLQTSLAAQNELLNSKDIILSEADSKRILADISKISIEINKLKGGDGKAKSEFSKGLEDSFKYLKGSTKEFAAGVSKDLSALSGSFNELGGALGGSDTQAGYLMGTIGSLIKVGSDAAGAFASFSSGDIIGGITKTVSAVSGFLSISKKVKEMNAKARKEVDDFYNNAISGERSYQELLQERAIKTVRDNKSLLNGIGEEMKLRQAQMEGWEKESLEIKDKLQGKQFVESESYEHGTWFRKAKVEKTYGSLAGKDFGELSKLLAEGKLEGDAKVLVERLKELEQKGVDAAAVMVQLGAELNQVFTGTTVNGLTDSLLNLFKSGKTGVKDMADFFESSMQDAALSMFKNNILTKAMNTFYDEFALAGKDGLTTAKIAQLKDLYNSLMGGVSEDFERIKSVTGLEIGKADNKNTMSAAVQGITADQAGLLAGQFGGQRIATIEGNELKRQGNETASQQLMVVRQNGLMLIRIEDNTRRNAETSEQYLPFLKDIANKIDGSKDISRAGGFL